MDADAARVLTRRSRWRSYLVLSRVSNVPTVWSNVLAGVVVSGAALVWSDAMWVSLGVSLLYVAGMFLNDACDRDADANERPDRPIPAGDVSAREVFTAGFVIMGLGAAAVTSRASLIWVAALVSAILLYDVRHKRNPLGPVIMGACRGLVYCVAAASVAGFVSTTVLAAGTALAVYVVGVTEFAKRSRGYGGLMPYLIAGISLFDAAVIALGGAAPPVVFVAALGFPLTLLCQRIVPGT